jgi:hypothetical protein
LEAANQWECPYGVVLPRRLVYVRPLSLLQAMRTDGLFNIRRVVIPTRWNQPFSLIPFGDIHRDSPSVSTDKWKEFLVYASHKKDALFLGMGDYLDSYSGSERRKIYDPDIHESTREREEEETRGRVASLAKELGFMRGKLIGLIGGNHFPQFSDGTTGDMLLANLLETQYLGACAAIRLSFEFIRKTLTRHKRSLGLSVDIFAHHGKGGGVTATGKFNAVEKLSQICEADIFLMGDNHARGVFPLGDKLRIENSPKGLSCGLVKRLLAELAHF